MKNIKLALFAIFTLTLAAGCKKDEKTECQKLEGKWQLESWREDGVEYFGTEFQSSIIDFDKLDGDEGDFDWTINYTDGSVEALNGDYEGNSSCTELTLSIAGSLPIEFDFEIDNDELLLEGNIDGTAVELEFELD